MRAPGQRRRQHGRRPARPLGARARGETRGGRPPVRLHRTSPSRLARRNLWARLREVNAAALLPALREKSRKYSELVAAIINNSFHSNSLLLDPRAALREAKSAPEGASREELQGSRKSDILPRRGRPHYHHFGARLRRANRFIANQL